jgi:hypothetical protein
VTLHEGGEGPTAGTTSPTQARAIVDELEARVERSRREDAGGSVADATERADDLPEDQDGLGEPPD